MPYDRTAPRKRPEDKQVKFNTTISPEAAAPELLEALEALFEECAMIHKYGGSADNTQAADEAIKAARAAIAKAKGE